MRLVHRIRIAAACSALILLTLPGVHPAIAGTFDPGPDFNGDGFADLAIGVPSESVGDVSFAGAVEVIYGTANGLNGNSPIDDQFWTQASPGVQGTVERSDRFGHALAVGDFDGDGYDDLAIGVPYEDTGAGTNAGVVQVLFGSAAGLTGGSNQLITQDTAGVDDVAEPYDHFGYVLEAARFGSDRFTDLAIGSPFEDVGTKTDSGVVQIVFGSSTGLTGTGDRLYSQDTTGIVDTADSGDHFGWSLAAANFDFQSTGIDLAIGAPDEDIGGVSNVGAVTVIYRVGYSSYQSEQWMQHGLSFDLVRDRAAGDRFGFALDAANFDDEIYADLAIGSPYEDLNGRDEGVVEVIYAAEDGLVEDSGHVRDIWHQDISGIAEVAETGDKFGYAIWAGSLGKGLRTGLAIGVPGESVGSRTGAGAVNVLYEAIDDSLGIGTANSEFWTQDSSGIEGTSETGDAFGTSLTSASFGYAGGPDLVIGVPNEDNEDDDDVNAGAVNVIYSRNGSNGLNASNDQFWWQASSTLHDSAESGDRFGSALAH